MSRPDSVNAQPMKRVQGSLDSNVAGVNQMHSSQDRMNSLIQSQVPDVLQRVDHAGMGAPDYDDQTLWGLQKHGLIVHKQIRLAALGIQEEASTDIFELADAWNRARYHHAGEDWGRCLEWRFLKD